MITKLIAPLIILISLCSSVSAKEFYPAALLKLDPYFSHHTILVEKSTHKLHLYLNEGTYPKLIKTYQIATGKKSGNKLFQGDHRTPEGVYQLTEFLTRKELLYRHGKAGEIYGVGAFVMNFPNPLDSEKTGGGIWLHSTNDETRVDKGLDSRGCVVMANKELIDIAKYIELNRTSIVVTHDIKYLNEAAWTKNRNDIRDQIRGWLAAWKKESIEDYISFYHKNFTDPSKGNLRSFKTYKRAVFNNPGIPEIDVQDISILQASDYVVVTFKQFYKSKTINDIGKKTLYMKKDQYYNWKIVAERWSKKGIDRANDKVSFTPSMRFFETNNADHILGSLTTKKN